MGGAQKAAMRPLFSPGQSSAAITARSAASLTSASVFGRVIPRSASSPARFVMTPGAGSRNGCPLDNAPVTSPSEPKRRHVQVRVSISPSASAPANAVSVSLAWTLSSADAEAAARA